MDDLEAAENQLQFFKENNYPLCFDFILRDYIHLMVVNLKRLKNKKEYEEYEKIIRKKLRNTLKRYEKELGLSLSDDFTVYKYAYPFEAKVYSRLKH